MEKNLISKEVKFQHSCGRAYTNKASRYVEDRPTQAPAMRDQAIDSVKLQVQQTLIDMRVLRGSHPCTDAM